MEMNLHIFTEGQTFCQLRKAISATFKRSTPCNLRSALGIFFLGFFFSGERKRTSWCPESASELRGLCHNVKYLIVSPFLEQILLL